MATPTTNAAKALTRELEVLKALASNGWLTTRHVGLWVWLESNEHTAAHKASQCLRRLETKKEVLKRDGAETLTGLSAWILTKRGADRLNVQLEADGYKGWAHHGYDAGLLDWSRSTICAGYLCDKLRSGAAGAVGPAGLRAGVIPALAGADGAYIWQHKDGSYTAIGVVAITNARAGVQARVKEILTRQQHIDLAGDPRITATLRKRIACDSGQARFKPLPVPVGASCFKPQPKDNRF